MIGKMGGNPYFIHATVQMLIEEGRLKRDSGEAMLTLQDEDEEALPESLKRAVVRRLSTHSESERSLLRAAALIGQEFEVAPVAACLGISFEEAESQLANMEGKGNFVRRLPGASSRWEFQETLTREVILSEMPPQDLRVLSAALATWWERNRLEDVDSLARFHHTVGEPTKGPRYMRRAIQRAMSDQLPEKVERYHRWLQEALAQQFIPPEERLREGLAIVADCYVQLGASPSLLRVLERLGEISTGPPLSLERAAWTAVIQMKADPKLARLTLEATEKEFIAAAQSVTSHVEALRLDAATDYALHDGHYDEVMRLGQRLLEMAQRDGSRRLTAVALYRMGWAQYSLGRTPEATDMLSRLRDVIASGEPPAEMIKVANLEGVLHASVGDLSAAARSFHESVDLARKHGHIFSLISDLLNLSQAQGELGQLERQEAAAREAVDLARRFNMNVPMALSDLGRALLTQERFQEALQILSQASAIMEAEGASDQMVICQIGMAAANLGLGNLPAAIVDLTAAEKWIGDFREEWVRFYGLKSRIHAARGEIALARRAIEEGLALIRSKGMELEESKLLQEMERLK
jgi:tetratricopeptide (TPR) repeat protein